MQHIQAGAAQAVYQRVPYRVTAVARTLLGVLLALAGVIGHASAEAFLADVAAAVRLLLCDLCVKRSV